MGILRINFRVIAQMISCHAEVMEKNCLSTNLTFNLKFTQLQAVL